MQVPSHRRGKKTDGAPFFLPFFHPSFLSSLSPSFPTKKIKPEECWWRVEVGGGGADGTKAFLFDSLSLVLFGFQLMDGWHDCGSLCRTCAVLYLVCVDGRACVFACDAYFRHVAHHSPAVWSWVLKSTRVRPC